MRRSLNVCELPVMCTLSLESDGTARFGGSAEEIAATLEAMGASAVGINCSSGPDQMEIYYSHYEPEAAGIPIIAKPNAGMPVITATGEVIYNMTPETFASHMENLYKAGASVLGGCCGTDPDYIRAVRKVLNRE